MCPGCGTSIRVRFEVPLFRPPHRQRSRTELAGENAFVGVHTAWVLLDAAFPGFVIGADHQVATTRPGWFSPAGNTGACSFAIELRQQCGNATTTAPPFCAMPAISRFQPRLLLLCKAAIPQRAIVTNDFRCRRRFVRLYAIRADPAKPMAGVGQIAMHLHAVFAVAPWPCAARHLHVTKLGQNRGQAGEVLYNDICRCCALLAELGIDSHH